MGALRPRTLLPAWASALLLWSLCWSSAVCQEEEVLPTAPPPGFATQYVTPLANLNVSQLVGRWYLAEQVSSEYPHNATVVVCVLLDFHYDDNNTLVVEPYTLHEGIRASPSSTLPVGDNGVWDQLRDGAPFFSYAIVDISEDSRYLSLAACSSGESRCVAMVTVRHIEDAARHDELTEVHRRLARAGIDHADKGFVRNLDTCRPSATPSPDLPAETGPSTARSEWRFVTYVLGNATNAL